MLYESKKKKLRRLWYQKLGISFCIVITVIFSFTKGLSIYDQLHDIEQTPKELRITSEKSKLAPADLETLKIQIISELRKAKSAKIQAEQLYMVQAPVKGVRLKLKQAKQWELREEAKLLALGNWEKQNGLTKHTGQKLELKLVDLQILVERAEQRALAKWDKEQTQVKQTEQQELAKLILTEMEVEIKSIKIKRNKRFQFNVASLALSILSLTIILRLFIKVKNRISLTFLNRIIYFIPEECVAELVALSRQLKSHNYPTWLIQIILFKCFLEVIFAFYIQIRIDNFWLPNKEKNKN